VRNALVRGKIQYKFEGGKKGGEHRIDSVVGRNPAHVEKKKGRDDQHL